MTSPNAAPTQQGLLYAVVNISTGERIGDLQRSHEDAYRIAQGLNIDARTKGDLRRYQPRDIDQALASDAERMSTLDESRHVATITRETTPRGILAAINRWAEIDYHPEAVHQLWAILGLVRGPDSDLASRRIKRDLTAVVRSLFLPRLSAITGADTNDNAATDATPDSLRSLADTLENAGDFPGIDSADAVARTQGFDWHYCMHAVSALRAAADILQSGTADPAQT